MTAFMEAKPVTEIEGNFFLKNIFWPILTLVG